MSRRPDAAQPDIEARAEAILAGGRAPSAAELLELVHAVNPTGRTLPDRVVERRYALKSRLQSLLVRLYADELRVEPQADPGVVALDHRFSGRDACHARVEDLDEDARALVRFRLDTQDRPAARPAGRRAGRDEPADTLARGEAALAEWDFDRARECFEAALAESDGGAPAAVALAELLVDRLGLDADALALEPSLGAAAKAATAVRSRLALAAARSGDARGARRWLAGVRGTPAADALAALARLALSGDDVDGARGALEELREADGAHAELAALADELDRHRAEERRPAEDALERMRAAGGPDLERHARELLAAHPDSALARRVLDECAERARRARLDELVRRAKEALERGSDEAAALLGQARALLPDDREIALLHARADADARARASRRRVERALAALAGPGDAAGLAEWMALAAEERAAVRARCSREELAWFDGVEIPDSGAKQRALVEAAKALLAARRALDDGNPAEAGRRLETPHAKDLPPAVPLRQELNGLLAQQRVIENARRCVDEIERLAECRERGKPAGPLSSGIDPELLPEEIRRCWDEVAALERQRQKFEDGCARTTALLASRRFLEARRHVFEMRARHPDTDFGSHLEVATCGLLRQWKHEPVVPEGGQATTRRLGLQFPEPLLARNHLALGDDGRLYMAECAGHEVLLLEVDPAAQAVVRVVRTATPERMREPRGSTPERAETPELFLGPGLLWLADLDGRLAAFELPDLLPAHWREAPKEQGARTVHHCQAEPGCLWTLKLVGTRAFAEPVDIGTWRRAGPTLPVCSMRLAAGPEPLVATMDADTLVLRAAAGPIRHRFHASPDVHTHALAHPAGTGWLELVLQGPRDAIRAEVRLRPEGPAAFVRDALAHPPDAATSLEAGLLYLLSPGRPGPGRLVALEPDGDALRVRWECEVPDRSALCGDRHARRVVLVWKAAPGVGTAVLGAQPPAIPDADLRESTEGSLPVLDVRGACGAPDFDQAERMAAQFRRLVGRSASDFRSFMRKAAAVDTRAELEWAATALFAGGGPDLRSVLGLPCRGPAPVPNPLWVAHRGAVDGQWEAVAPVAETARRGPREGPPPPPAEARHASHLLGLALAHLGRWDEARQAWSTAAPADGASDTCRLDDALDWLDAVRAPPGTPGRRLAGRVTAAVVAHDAALAAGDASGALRAILCGDVVRAREKQSSARLAEALLDGPAVEGAERVWRDFLVRRAWRILLTKSPDLWLPGARDEARLKQTAARIGDHVKERDLRWDREFARANGLESKDEG